MVFVTAALSAAVWLAQSLRLIDLIVNRGLSLDVFLYLALLILPRFLDIVLPIGVFIAVLFTFNRLTAESELVVMRAAGLGPMALARPVLILAAIAFAILMSLSLYVLPVTSQAFKDLQFEIRNRFVSSLIQEGTFTTVSDKLTILHPQPRRQRRRRRLLDQRQPRPTAAGHDPCRARRVCRHAGRLADRHGEREPAAIRPANPQALGSDLPALHARPRQLAGRPGRALSRGAGALSRRAAVPADPLDPLVRQSFIMEAASTAAGPAVGARLCVDTARLSAARRSSAGAGRSSASSLAIGAAFLFQTASLGVNDLAARFDQAIPLMYVIDLLPFVVGLTILQHRGIRFGYSLAGLCRRPRALTIGSAREAPALHLGKTLSAYIARHFFGWFCGVFGAMAVITFLADYIELIRRGGSRIQATLGLLLEMAALAVAADRARGAAVRDPVRNDARLLAADPQQRARHRARRRRLGMAISDPGGARGAADRHRRGDDLQPACLAWPRRPSKSSTPESSAVAVRAIRCCRTRVFGFGRATRTGDQIIIHGAKFASPDRLLDNVSIFFFDDHTRFTSRIDARTARLETGNWLIEDGVRWRPDKPPEAFAQWQLPTQLTPRKIEESFASPDTMSFWDLPGFIELLGAVRISRRNAIGCITTSCSPVRFCCVRWCLSPLFSACGCSAAAARR